MSVKTRLWILGTVLVCGALVLLGVTGGLLPQMTSAATTEGLADSTEQQNESQQAQLTRLQNAKQNGDELASTLAELRIALPATAATSEWVGELGRIEKSTQAVVTAFSLPNPLVSKESGEQAASDGTAGAETSAGPQKIPFVMTASAPSLASVSDFVSALQTGDRLVLVGSVKISVQPGSSAADEKWIAEIAGFMFAELDG